MWCLVWQHQASHGGVVGSAGSQTPPRPAESESACDKNTDAGLSGKAFDYIERKAEESEEWGDQ